MFGGVSAKQEKPVKTDISARYLSRFIVEIKLIS